ncbi:MAG: sugar ABC transporter substrate-binding protein [Pseudomonadota bacterium]
MKKHFIWKIIFLALGCLILQACEQGPAVPEPDKEAEPQTPKIALIMKSLANEFFINMAEGTRQHQAANPELYELVINGTKDESDLAQQVKLVEQMMVTGADAIVIAPADSKALIPVLKRAQQAGIVVVNIDNKLDAEILQEQSISIPFVGPDNREGAKLAGDHLAKSLSAGDEAAIIGGISTAFNAQQRQAGFEDAMNSAGVNIVSIQAGDWEQAKASTVAAAIITEYPQLKAILCSNDNMAMGAVAAIKQASKQGEIQVIGFDNINATHPLLRDGSILATVDQYGRRLAIFGVEYALDILKGGKTPADKKTPVDLILVKDLPST